MLSVPAEIETSQDVYTMLRHLYGIEARILPPLLQVLSVTRDETGHYHMLRIASQTPKSDWDFFVLNAMRAQSQAIIISGAILRAEPELHYGPQGPGKSPLGLEAYRQTLGFDGPPTIAIMTRGDIDFQHSLFEGANPIIVYTTPDSASRLQEVAPPLTTVVGHPDLNLRRVVQTLRQTEHCAAISIEAGATLANTLYSDHGSLPEVFLTVFDGDLPPEVRGPRWLHEDTLQTNFNCEHPQSVVRSWDGDWRFERWVPKRTIASNANATPTL